MRRQTIGGKPVNIKASVDGSRWARDSIASATSVETFVDKTRQLAERVKQFKYNYGNRQYIVNNDII